MESKYRSNLPDIKSFNSMKRSNLLETISWRNLNEEYFFVGFNDGLDRSL